MPVGCSQSDVERFYGRTDWREDETQAVCEVKGCSNPRAVGAQFEGCPACELEMTLESDLDDWVGGEKARQEHLEQMFQLFKEGM